MSKPAVRPWDESWWSYVAREGFPTRRERYARIERGPGSWVARKEPVHDFLAELENHKEKPEDWLL